MIDCPIQRAPQKRPAIEMPGTTLTYGTLDQLIKGHARLPESLVLPARQDLQTITTLFAALRQRIPVYLSRPGTKSPQTPLPFPAVALQTSGSAGSPKWALLTMSNLLASAHSAIKVLGIDSQSRYLLTLPLFHVAGLATLFRTFLAGATLVLSDHPLETALLAHAITHTSLVPTQLYRLVQHPATYPHLHSLLIGGSPLAPALRSQAAHLPIDISYGMTEMASLIALNGTPLPHAQVSLSPENETLVRGPALFHGYLGNPIDRSQWFPTGDLGQCDNGNLTIIGRKDNLFISGGENIQPEEIERALELHPDIIASIVVPQPDPEWGMRPVAFIKQRTARPLSLKEIHTFLSDHLERYKQPVAVRPLPASSGLKPSRQALQKEVAGTS